jgi:2-methylisocitrate lyase-like PEP mutase family enzyme
MSVALDTKARALAELHARPEILTVVNVWDAISASVVASTPGTHALATASHSIAATFGYPDGEVIPLELMLDMVGRIVAVTDLPVTADLEGGYGDAAETIRRAIGVGVVGANIEDQLKPLPEAAAQVAAIMAAGRAEGIEFVLNARTDVLLRAGDRPRAAVISEAGERGRAYLDAGAPCVFVPGKLDETELITLVDALGSQKLSVLGLPGMVSLGRMAEIGVARVSYGPMPQRVALTSLQMLVEDVAAGGGVPPTMRQLT